jgi:hypothetical protein
MLKPYLFLIFSLFFINFSSGQIVNIPDANFKNILLNTNCGDTLAGGDNYLSVDINHDGEIQVWEAKKIKRLFLTELNLYNVTGIEEFSGLLELYCGNNHLMSLDLHNAINLQTLFCYYNELSSLNIEGITSLEVVYCQKNQLTTLNINNSLNLRALTCQYNKIHHLDMSNLTHLITLNCVENEMETLNIDGASSLVYFFCFSNKLSSLNLNGVSSLYALNCSYNQLLTLSLEGATNLNEVDCKNNLLTSINLQTVSNLFRMNCSFNKLTNIDAQNNYSLKELYCNDNEITTINIKNNSSEEYFNFLNNPLTTICCDVNDYLYVLSFINPVSFPNCEVSATCIFIPPQPDFSYITLHNTLDNDNNGCDANDPNFANIKFNFLSDSIGAIITDTSRFSNIPLFSGANVITPELEHPNYFNISPTSITINIPADSSPYFQQFCITPNGTHHDTQVSILPTSVARPGYDASYQIVYKNTGTQSENGSLFFAFNDNLLDLVSSSLPPTAQINILQWSFTDLKPSESRTISLVFNVNSPVETPAVNIGDSLLMVVSLQNLVADETPNDNIFSLNQVVVGSLDPNDKTCLEGTKIKLNQVGDYLHYVIRFENTGTFAAENIVVRDYLDPAKFDINSLQIIKSSHVCETHLVTGNEVEFIFKNINLPFTEPEKHGFVAFKIKTKSSLVVGNKVTNKANITFDFNAPIFTNMTSTTVVGNGTIATKTPDNTLDFTIFPNPTSDNFTLASPIGAMIKIINSQGQIVLQTVANEEVTGVNMGNQPSGVYYVFMQKDEYVTGKVLQLIR